MSREATIRPQLSFARGQSGAVLVVSLLLLMVMTILALGASQATRMQQRMAGNARDHDLAFQSAEAGLRTGERLVDDPTVTAAPYPCSSGRCQIYELNILSSNVAYQPVSWWNSQAWSYAGTTAWSATTSSAIGGSAGLAGADPQFFVEEVEEVTDTLTIPPSGPPPSRMYYRITSSGQGGSAAAQVVLQSTFARRF
jgi:type IV pilus assembly protein PilX